MRSELVADNIYISDSWLAFTQILAIGIILSVAGLVLRAKGGSFLYRLLMSWIVISGVVFLLCGLPELLFKPGFVAAFDDWLKRLSCRLFAEDTIRLARAKVLIRISR